MGDLRTLTCGHSLVVCVGGCMYNRDERCKDARVACILLKNH